MSEKNQNRLKWIFTAIILVGSLGFTGWLMFRGSSETEFIVNTDTNTVLIEGMYSKELLIDSETEINLISPLNITRRTNGSAIGDTLKGYFTLEGDIAVYLNLGDSTLQWIEIIINDEYYYINASIESETTALYNEIIALQD